MACEADEPPSGSWRAVSGDDPLVGCNECGPYESNFYSTSSFLGCEDVMKPCEGNCNSYNHESDAHAELLERAQADCQASNGSNTTVVSCTYERVNWGFGNNNCYYGYVRITSYSWRYNY